MAASPRGRLPLRPCARCSPRAPAREEATLSRAPVLWCLLAAAFFGASTPASKVLLAQMDPFALAGWLYVGAGLFALPFSLRGGSRGARRSRRNLLRVSGAVLFGGVLGPVLMLFGLRLAPAASGALWMNLETPLTAVLAVVLFKEHLDGRGRLAIVLVAIASVALAAPGGFSLAPAALLFLAASSCWALDNNFTALIDGFTPAQSTLVKGLMAGGVNLSLSLVVGEPSPAVLDATLAAGVGTLAYGASLVLYVSAAHHLGAARAQLAFATAPFFGVTLAWTALGEPVLAVQLAAGALMALGVYLSIGDAHRHRHRHEALTHTHWHRHDDGHHAHEHEPKQEQTHERRRSWHAHEHTHERLEHEHVHRSDLHHRHH